jgi:hypothetical protein
METVEDKKEDIKQPLIAQVADEESAAITATPAATTAVALKINKIDSEDTTT